MLGTAPKAFSQVLISKEYFPKWQLPKSVLAAALGPHCSLRRLRRPNLTFGKLPLGKLHSWEVATWEAALGKIPNSIAFIMRVDIQFSRLGRLWGVATILSLILPKQITCNFSYFFRTVKLLFFGLNSQEEVIGKILVEYLLLLCHYF